LITILQLKLIMVTILMKKINL